MMMLPIKEIENYLEKNLNAQSIVHGFGHLKRTAIGARWFVGILKGSGEEKKIAYLAGLIHDLKRPLSEKVDHSELSVNEARKVLGKFEVEEELAEKVLEMIGAHREASGNNLIVQSVYLSDKILEQSGAYNTLRRCTFVGECFDYRDWNWKKAIDYQFTWRMKKFNPAVFPERFLELVEYQYAWMAEYFEAFKRNEEWALGLGKICHGTGRAHGMGFEEMIENLGESGEIGRYRKEALDYINGNKFKEFEGMIR